MDDYISLAIPTSQEQLTHVATAIMMGVHDVFPADINDDNDPLSLKKLEKLEAMWALHKDIPGFTFDGVEKTLWLEQPKRDALLTILHGWIRATRDKSCGITFAQFKLVISKLRHAFISILTGTVCFRHATVF